MSWFSNIVSTVKGSEDFSDIKTSSVRDFLNGNIFIKKFMRKQYRLILLIALLAFIYIGNRYYCESQIKKAEQLESQLTDLQYLSLPVSAELLQLSRKSTVQTKIAQHNLDLKESETPPIYLP